MPYATPTAAELTAQWGSAWKNLPDAFNLRMRRATSWLERAEKEMKAGDLDAAFIFYWIAFNAAYAQDRPRDPDTRESDLFNDYFRRLLKHDSGQVIYHAIWERFPGSISKLLENQYVFQPFWSYHAGRGHKSWRLEFEASKLSVREAFAERDTLGTLNVLFSRLYTLRIQLMHGGATWESSVNREQVKDGADILAFLVPVFVRLMLGHPKAQWGRPDYPRVPEGE